MQTRKLLIADSSEEICLALTDLLSERYHICTCRSGDRALELLRSFSPDLVYIDLMLPKIDGIAVLQAAMQEGIRPKVLASAGLQSIYIEEALSRLQVAYMVKRPCDLKAIAGHIDEMAGITSCMPAAVPHPQVDASAILLQLGIRSHLDGYHYVMTGYPLFLRNPQQTVTKELYPAIAKIHGKTGMQVERSIRNAIDTAWKRRDDRLWQQFFPPGPDGTVPRPTNTQLMHTLLRLLSSRNSAEKVG